MTDQITADPGVSAESGEAGEEMHVHKPKAAHGLREFLSEIGIIVIGVLIALSAEQVVEQLHWNERMREVHAQLLAETASNTSSALYWLAVSPCWDWQVKQLDEEVWDARRTGTIKPAPYPYAPGLVEFTSDAWLNARSLQATDHMGEDEVKNFTAAYFMATELPGNITRLHEMAAELEPLNRPLDHVSPAEADELLAKIGHVRELQSRTELAMTLLIARADKLHAPIAQDWAQSQEAGRLREVRKSTPCVADPRAVLRGIRERR
jgi:hypothetical protein